MHLRKKYPGCSDGGCIFGHPGGMHTNGGCHCLKLKMTPDDRVYLRKQITLLRWDRNRWHEIHYKLFDLIPEENLTKAIEIIDSTRLKKDN